MDRITTAMILIALLSIGAGHIIGWYSHKRRCHRKYGNAY